MSNSSFVLRALNILGLEEILKLSEVLRAKQIPLKKVAGEEFVVWEDQDEDIPDSAPAHRTDAKILPFPSPHSVNDLEPLEPEVPQQQEQKHETAPSQIASSDLLLWQREISKSSGNATKKVDAVKGYKRATDMYVVKSPDIAGKEKIRFASTNGVLINKKQA